MKFDSFSRCFSLLPDIWKLKGKKDFLEKKGQVFIVLAPFLVKRKQQDKTEIKLMNNLPNDPMMLFSAINMYLRDTYPSLDALCSDMQIDRKELTEKLAAAGFEYNAEQNKFW